MHCYLVWHDVHEQAQYAKNGGEACLRCLYPLLTNLSKMNDTAPFKMNERELEGAIGTSGLFIDLCNQFSNVRVKPFVYPIPVIASIFVDTMHELMR